MRKLPLFSAVLSLFLLVTASITRAQKISTEKGLTTAVFNLPQGKVKIYLPDDIRQGDVITGTIVAEPEGHNARQVEKNLAELKKYTANVDGNKYNVSEKPEKFKWVVAADRKLSAAIELLNANGTKAGQLPVQLKLPDNTQPVSEGCAIPSHALAGEPMQIKGSFDGDASNTKCSLDNKPLEILTESPRQICTPVPIDMIDPGGNRAMLVQENEKPACSKGISLVELKASVPKTNLKKGEKTILTVEVTGLQNLPDTAVLTLRNNSTGTVVLSPSNKIAIAILPDSVKSGTYTRQFNVQSVATGDFIITIDLALPAPGDNNLYGFFCSDKCSPVGKETDAQVGEVGISSSVGSNPDAEDKAFKTAKWVLENGDLFGATGNEEAALQALEKIGRTRGYVIWVKPCWKRCEEGFFCNDWKQYCGAWIPVIWVDGLENSGNNTFTATGGRSSTGKDKIEGLTRDELLKLAIKIGNGVVKKK